MLKLLIHSKLCSITPVATKVHVILWSFLVLTWMRDTSELVWHVTLWNNKKKDVRTIWIRSPITYASVVHSTWPSQVMWWTRAPTNNKWQKKKKKKKTLHMLTYDTMRGCWLTSLMVCINDKFHDIRERNATMMSEIWTMNIHSLGFQDIKECVTLCLGCTLPQFIATPLNRHKIPVWGGSCR